ncbi:cytochrome [Rhodococcus oxybenzonivorans]|uniref:Cytochrome n=2 Tax=Rhodococcus oxybenzonivorans TaxID=1990687 RepID=A0A2S2BZ41_9NOCA|nr:cytochrome [Rhodococcus oxybenzonivorans]
MDTQHSDQPISFADPDVYACPFPAYDRLREEQPVYCDPKSGHYVLTRYDDVRKAMLNVAALSNNTGVMGDRWASEANHLFETEGWLPMNTLVSNDPPGHRAYRALVDKVFTTQKVRSLEPRIQQLVDELIDDFVGLSEIDFLAAFAVPLPMYVISEQLGVAHEDRAQFKHWSDVAMESMNPLVTPERQIVLARELIAMQRYMARQIDRVRATPDDKLLSRLANSETEGRRLDMRELQSLILQILVAGNETTTTTLALGMKTLIERPDLADTVRRDPGYAQLFVEETLRVTAPLQTLFRRALADVEIGGVTIPLGSMVEVRFGAANRDPRQFACPADVDLDRPNSASHLSFGAGIHMCVGNQLARAELRLAFQTLTRRLTGFRTTRGSDSLHWMDNYTAYGPDRMWMTFEVQG